MFELHVQPTVSSLIDRAVFIALQVFNLDPEQVLDNCDFDDWFLQTFWMAFDDLFSQETGEEN